MNSTAIETWRAAGGPLSTICKITTGTAAAAGLLLGPLTAVAGASGSYPPATSCSVSAGPDSEAAGTGETITGTGFAPASTVVLSVGNGGAGLGTQVTDSSGNFSLSTMDLNGLSGSNSIVAASPGCTVESTYAVHAASTRVSTTSALPNTGSPDLELAGVGGALIGTGAVLVLGLRRRKG